MCLLLPHDSYLGYRRRQSSNAISLEGFLGTEVGKR